MKNPLRHPDKTVVLIAADAEWEVSLDHYAVRKVETRAFESFHREFGDSGVPTIFVHSGCGKVCAAAAAQFAIDRWQPGFVGLLGTCGGIKDKVELGDTILATETVIYDIHERSCGQAEMIERFRTTLDLSWLEEQYPPHAERGVIATADQDLDPLRLVELERMRALAADWEAGAFAHVAQTLNSVKCLILKTVTDLTSQEGNPIYNNDEEFKKRVRKYLPALLGSFEEWLVSEDWKGGGVHPN